MGKPVTFKVSEAADVEMFFDVPREKTTISIALGAASFFISFVPPTGSGPTMSVVGYKGSKNYSDSVPLLSDDSHISMRIFVDNVVAECYWQGGRVAMMVPIVPGFTTAELSSTAPVQLTSATVYSMSEIMVS